MSSEQRTAANPEIYITSSGHGFFLYEYPLKDPKMGKVTPVRFIVVDRLLGAEFWSATRFYLLLAARETGGEAPLWEALVAAERCARRYGLSGESCGKRRPVAKLSNRGARYALNRKAERGELRGFDGSALSPQQYLAVQLRDFRRDRGDPNLAFVKAEFGTAAVLPWGLQRVPAFSEWASAFTDEYEAARGPVVQPAIGEDGTPKYTFSHEWRDQLLARAELGGVALEYELGARVIDWVLSFLFQRALEEIRQEFPKEWATIGELGHRLHEAFYRIWPGAGGALLCLPALDRHEEIRLLVHDPVKLAAGTLKQPGGDQFLATIAFEPQKLPEAIRQIASDGLCVRWIMETDPKLERPDEYDPSRKDRYLFLDHDRVAAESALVRKSKARRRRPDDHYRDERLLHQHPEDQILEAASRQAERQVSEGKLLGDAVEKSVISLKERDLLNGFYFEARTLAELAELLGYSDETVVCRAKRIALRKIEDAARSDPRLAALRADRLGSGSG